MKTVQKLRWMVFKRQVEAFLRNDLFLCTSTITIIEVLRSKLYPSAYNTFLKFTKRKGVDIASVTRDVAIIAHEIRDYYSKVSDEINVSITTPDAIMG